MRTRAKGHTGHVANVTVELPGDPGIHVTALCAAETALALLEAVRNGRNGSADDGPPPGFTTPMHACGEELAARLARARGAVVHATCE